MCVTSPLANFQPNWTSRSKVSISSHFICSLSLPLVGGQGGGEKMKKMAKKNSISPYFDASGNKNIGATIRIGREIRCLPYAGFFSLCIICNLYFLHIFLDVSNKLCVIYILFCFFCILYLFSVFLMFCILHILYSKLHIFFLFFLYFTIFLFLLWLLNIFFFLFFVSYFSFFLSLYVIKVVHFFFIIIYVLTTVTWYS